jgi:glycosyltransferase involved in cell wall biosynthesis
MTMSAARAVRVADRIVLLRDVPDEDLSALYAGCRMFVFPSLYEGFGLPVLEAMTHGVPVACSRSSSIPEVAGDAAEFFDPHSVSGIAESMQGLLDNSDRAVHLAQAGRTRARLFTWEKTAAGVLAAVRSFVQRSSCKADMRGATPEG